uniref:Uncharacterized protein n=1 Tax=Oryza rufipogon TaxID=4529 RepID=A0A0E0PF55_ORYRU
MHDGGLPHLVLLRVYAGLAATVPPCPILCPPMLAARVLARHGVAAPGSLATLYAGARALDGAFFLASPGPDRQLQPPTPPLRLLRPRDAARCHSPAACRRCSRARPLMPPLRLLQPPQPLSAADALAWVEAHAAARPEAKRSPRCAHAEREEKKEKRLGCN